MSKEYQNSSKIITYTYDKRYYYVVTEYNEGDSLYESVLKNDGYNA